MLELVDSLASEVSVSNGVGVRISPGALKTEACSEFSEKHELCSGQACYKMGGWRNWYTRALEVRMG